MDQDRRSMLLFWSDIPVVGRVVRWQGGKGGRVARWESGKCGKKVRWQGGRFLVLFKGRRCSVSSRFRPFVSDANQQNEGAKWV